MAPTGNKHDKGKGKVLDKSPATHITQSPDFLSERVNFSNVPLQLQQALLNIFRDALPIPSDLQIRQVIQQVKGHLYSRNFAKAFGSPEYLHAYALRWSASRALAYADIFAGLDVTSKWAKDQSENAQDKTHKSHGGKVLCIGGGSGAEVVAWAAMVEMCSLPLISITVIDVADWSEVLVNLRAAITEPPVLSSHASAARRDDSQPLLDSSRLHVKFRRHDILDCSEAELKLFVADMALVSILFTLNELFSKSISSTTAFLFKLTDFMKPGGCLIVVDSPGSYAEVTLGKDGNAKKYPMRWLLDHTLLEMAGKDLAGNSKWVKSVDVESKWFRINEALKYPIDLENMRYQLHVYQRCGNDQVLVVE